MDENNLQPGKRGASRSVVALAQRDIALLGGIE